MSDLQVYLDGRLVPASEARVSVFDAGLLHGASAFTTMLARNGKVFRIRRHVERLLATSRLLGLRIDAAGEHLASAAEEVLRANGLRDARMRITVTPGAVRDEEPAATVIITAEPAQECPAAWYEKGISVVVSSFRQGRGDPTFGNKTGNYLLRVLARQEAARKGAEEAIWFTAADNLLAEACFCNVFLVMDGGAAPSETAGAEGDSSQPSPPAVVTPPAAIVRTPPLDTPVLPGIVREAVLELCAALAIPCDDSSPLTVRHMLAAREMFLTSSTAGIRPVVRVERHPVGKEMPGPLTRRLMEAYKELLDKECS